jgi:cell division septal protein FtsQ
MRYRPKKHSTSRTRFDVALAQRAQRRSSRLSSRLPRVRGWVVIAIAVVGLAVAGARWFMGDDWRINEIEVKNNMGVPVEAIIGASALHAEHFQFTDLDKAAKAIDDLPGVEAAQVTCTWNGHAACMILIQPARALAFWESPRGNLWSDYEGKVQRALDAVQAKLTIHVEEGEPPALTERVNPRLLRAMNELLAAQPNITHYLYSREYGLIWLNEDQWRVRLGDAPYDGVMSEKLKLARALRSQLKVHGVRPKVLDVRFVEAPYYIK